MAHKKHKEFRWQFLAASFAAGAALGVTGAALVRGRIMRDPIDFEDSNDWGNEVNPETNLDAEQPGLATSIPAVEGGNTSATSPVSR
ncbi:hypothetical protein [Polymorphospora rubra]|uniref:hypothetical protein n=1 Tax=Polymorphospora rubra TaxID=338584 RepID=UPI0033FB77F1